MKNPYLNETVIRGTMRPQDLIPRFLDILCELNTPQYHQLLTAAFPLPPAYVADEGDDSEWWDSDECSWFLNDVLFDSLNDCAPDGYYFGAHPGDGSDYGFWEVEE